MNLKIMLKKIWLSLITLLLIPHILILKFHPSRKIIELDIAIWGRCLNLSNRTNKEVRTSCNFIYLMAFYPEYRSLFYKRLNLLGKILSFLFRPMPTLYIYTIKIGSGLFIQHGFATVITAKSIGRNCWINQQVTIGFLDDTRYPTIGDNVTIYAGAKVLGKIRIGDNSVVGANAVVTKDVPENCTVVGVPAYIVRKNGIKVKEPL